MSYGDGFSNVPRPVYGHGLVYIATGFQQPSLLAVRADGAGDVTRTHVAWTLRRGAPFTPSPLLVGDELYIVSDIGIAYVPGREDRRDALASSGLAATTPRRRCLPTAASTSSARKGVHGDRARASIPRLATNTLDGATLASMARQRFDLHPDGQLLYRIATRPVS